MRVALIVILSLTSLSGSTQSWVGLGIGASTSRLEFTGTDGIRNRDLAGLPGVSTSFFYQQKVSKKNQKKFSSKTVLSTELGFKSARIKDRESSLLTTWSMQYLTGNLTLRRRVGSKHKVNSFYGVGLFTDYLLSGTQNKGFEQFDLTNDLRRRVAGVIAEFGLSYYHSDDSYSTLKLSYLHGISNLEKDPGQKAFLYVLKISASVFFEFNSKGKR